MVNPENGHGTNPSCGVRNLPLNHYNEARHYRQAPSRTSSEGTGSAEKDRTQCQSFRPKTHQEHVPHVYTAHVRILLPHRENSTRSDARISTPREGILHGCNWNIQSTSSLVPETIQDRRLQGAKDKSARENANPHIGMRSSGQLSVGTAFTLADNTKPSQYTETVWNEADSHKIRKLPIPSDLRHPAFYLKKNAHRVLSMKWILHRFPAGPHLVREKMGGIGKIAQGRLNRIIPQAIWSKQNTRDVIGTIDAIL